ncbi:MAG: tetratricopeptide repeat protein, partial [Planctomycetota bacterium]|nr:tetratricopeptide repeat protein [Planctomycetota bacterium]
ENAREHWNGYLVRYEGREHMDAVQLGLAHAGQGTESLEALLRRNPNSPLAHNALFEWARQLEAAGTNAGAVERYRELSAQHPGSEHASTAHYSLAWSLHSLNRFQEASAVLNVLIARDIDLPMQVAARELLSWTSIEGDDLQLADDNYRQLSQTKLEASRIYAAAKKLALAFKAKGNNERALELLLPFAREDSAPELAVQALVDCAWIHLDAGQASEAENHVRGAAKLSNADGSVSEAAFFVGEAHFATEKFDRAAALYDYAAGAEGSPVAAQALYKLGFAKLSASDPKGAAQAFARLTTGHPNSSLYGESLYLQGEAWIRSGDLQASLAPLRELRKTQRKHAVLPKALFRLGLTLQQVGEPKEGLEVLSQLVGKFADFEAWVEAELYRGLCLVDLDRGREARGAFDRVLAKDKGVLSARARIQIGRLHLVQDDFESGLAEFLKVSLLYAHDEEVAEAMFLAGHCLENQDSRDAAIKQYRQAVKEHANTVYAKQCADRLRVLGQ